MFKFFYFFEIRQNLKYTAVNWVKIDQKMLLLFKFIEKLDEKMRN